ncbi:hypothetical protein AVEN_195276-1 [Araneus ventricosus]|uniref:Uncharacterized protein n=1 Tax=Araneus ventricosus TaxID=182803 RepID=A0A4Y2G0Q5_ARAVE|nr:hypothetical protein AVEN_195276-1 [Araneus ventricosus]
MYMERLDQTALRGASPINTSHITPQPPPPGVGPLLPVSTDSGTFVPRPFESEDPLKDASVPNERSIDDRMEEFQRKLEKRHRYSRDRGSRSRSRSSERHRSRSSSRSRTYSSSKSWTRSPSRSSHRSSRSRSRTPFSSRSRSRSYSHSRSRSWSKKRSYTRSRSRTRTDSRSRSRSRAESSIRRRGHDSRDRVRSPISRGRSRSYSPKGYRVSSHRNLSYSNKHSYTPPQYTSGASYQSQYGPPPTILPLPVVRPPAFPPHHLHSMPPPIQPMHSRPVEQYPVERQPKYPYGDQYPLYDMFPPKYPHQRYERDQREHRVVRYDKRSEYQRHQEEVPHRIPGYIGERSRDYKPRYRQTREPQRKEIRELPQISESDMRVIHSKESSAESSSKKKDEKLSVRHKKHHHHHKSKEVKKLDNKIPVMVSGDKQAESSKNLISDELTAEKDKEKNNSIESDSKTTKSTEKVKDKKHKHKKHKTADQSLKKKKSAKKEKVEGAPSTDSDLPTKTKVKKKKTKLKTIEEEKDTEPASKEIEQSPVSELPAKTEETVESKDTTVVVSKDTTVVVSKDTTVEDNVKPVEDPDVLDIFADDPEAADLNAELNPEDNTADLENVATDNLELVETENIEMSGNSEEEEEVEEAVEDENVLCVDMPGISKWEREESEDEDTDLLQHRSSAVASKDEKGALPSDIISRAENVLLAKQFKPRIDRKDTSDSKNSSDVSSPEHSSTKHKETLELKSVVNSEQLKSDTLHVTISNSKDKRSVYSRKDDTKNSKTEIVSKRDRYDRSNRHNHHDDNSTRRAVAVHSARNERERFPDRSDRRERRHTPPREVGRNSSHDRRDYSRKERDRADDAYLREERKHRFDDYYGSSSSRTDSRDRRRPATVVSSSRSRKPYERDSAHHSEREKQESRKRSRSKSHDSGGSHNSYRKKSDRKYNESAEEHRSQKISKARVHLEEKEPPRRKHSPIKAPDSNTSLPKPVRRNYEDELKFEPDYDDFSEEERSRESKDRQKRKASSPEGSRKVAKMERNVKIDSGVKVLKADKSSVTSSVSSSAASESDSSDSDDQKGSKNKNSDSDYKQKHKKSKHKKHKKHKHKHKKKKSHKSKKD